MRGRAVTVTRKCVPPLAHSGEVPAATCLFVSLQQFTLSIRFTACNLSVFRREVWEGGRTSEHGGGGKVGVSCPTHPTCRSRTIVALSQQAPQPCG